MNGPTLYQRLRRVALPQLQHYVTDLTVHDRKICSALKPGDCAIYAVRDSGTHFACYRNMDDVDAVKAAHTAQRAIDYIDAILACSSTVTWYLLECTSPRRGTVSPISFSKARLLCMQTRDRLKVVAARTPDGRIAA